jgi:hypothetical protein
MRCDGGLAPRLNCKNAGSACSHGADTGGRSASPRPAAHRQEVGPQPRMRAVGLVQLCSQAASMCFGLINEPDIILHSSGGRRRRLGCRDVVSVAFPLPETSRELLPSIGKPISKPPIGTSNWHLQLAISRETRKPPAAANSLSPPAPSEL